MVALDHLIPRLLADQLVVLKEPTRISVVKVLQVALEGEEPLPINSNLEEGQTLAASETIPESEGSPPETD